MDNSPPDWKQFELAVTSFIEAIGQGAKVTHDAKLPDSHTVYPRQRDVWVEWSLWGHFPAKALISCKYWAIPLDQKDIDHFNGEFISSGADIGIVYAKSGFNDRAIEKAKTLRFHCCKLYRDEPPELPEMLTLGLAYYFRPQYGITVYGDDGAYNFKKWDEVLQLSTGGSTVYQVFTEALDEYQRSDDIRHRWRLAKEGKKEIAPVREEGKPPLDVEMQIRDRIFQAKVEYSLLDGSYNLTSEQFIGSETTPWIDTKSVYPGKGWNEITDIPAEVPKRLSALFTKVDATVALRKFAERIYPE